MKITVELTGIYENFYKEQMKKWNVTKAEILRMALRGWMIDLSENETSTCELVEELVKTKLEAIPLKDLPFN